MLAVAVLATSATGGWTEPVPADGASGSALQAARLAGPRSLLLRVTQQRYLTLDGSASIWTRLTLQHKANTFRPER